MPDLNRDSLRRLLTPALAIIAVAIIAGAVGYVTAGSSGGGTSSATSAEQRYLRGVIGSVSGEKLTITTEAGARELRLANNAPVEALRPTALTNIADGDWLNGGAVGHNQTMFALIGIVVIPSSLLESQP